jgi:diguanylate cyclase (GGDEF)-like protein
MQRAANHRRLAVANTAMMSRDGTHRHVLHGIAALVGGDQSSSGLWESCAALFAGALGAQRVTIAVRDGEGDRVASSHAAGDDGPPAAHVVDVSIAFRGKTVGNIRVESVAELDAESLDMLHSCAAIIAPLVEADRDREDLARLERIVYTDALTGLFNRRKFDETIAAEWKRNARDGSEITVLILDVDYFKVYNDTYGHQMGDRCLARIAEALHGCLNRPADVLARYGGEEFVAVLPATGLQGGILLAERLRDAVADAGIEHSGSTLNRVSISIGVACVVPDIAKPPSDLVERADAALYRAKLAGRNRTAAENYESDASPAKRTNTNSPHALPERSTAPIGRERETLDIRTALERKRLVTIVAFGGIGKTRLAIETASGTEHLYPDGIRFVDLSAVSDPRAVASVVGAALGIQIGFDAPAASALDALGGKRALLLLDNCEHVRESVASFAAAVLDATDGIRILATSREAFGVAGEFAYQLAPLPLAPSVALFVERAQAIKRDFSLTDRNAAIVERICRELEGIPLAIELAAPRLRVFSLEQLAEKLAEHVHLLSLGRHEGAARQQTMRALIAWSFDALAPAEQMLFRRLGVFAGGWTIEGASTVCSGDGVDSWNVLDLLIGFVEKSLVIVETGRDTRYRMLAPLREFARTQLEESGEIDASNDRHLDFYRNLFERSDGAYWLGDASESFEDPVAELDNARAALEWGLQAKHDVAGAALLAASLSRFWFFARDEGRRWAELASQLLPAGEDPAIEARLDLGFAQLEAFPSQATRQHAYRAMQYYRAAGDRIRTAEALYHLSMTMALYYPDERPLAEAYAAEGLAIARALDAKRLVILALRAKAQVTDPRELDVRRSLLLEGLELARQQTDNERVIAIFLMSLSELEFEAARFSDAALYGAQAVRAAEASGAARFITLTKANLAHYAFAVEDWAAGKREALQAIRLADLDRDQYSLTIAMHALASLDAGTGDALRAARLMGFCEARFGALHAPRQEGSCEESIFLRMRAASIEALGADAFDKAMAQGGALWPEEAMREALAGR